MTGIQESLVSRIKTLIDGAAAGYVIPDTTRAISFKPESDLAVLAVKPVINLIPIGFNSDRVRLLRQPIWEVEVPFQVAIQMKVNEQVIANVWPLVELSEQVMATCETDLDTAPKFSWLRTEMKYDENELTYSYQDLMQNSVFLTIFKPIYKYLKQPS